MKRIGGREAKMKGVVALAHALLPIVYYVLSTRQNYIEFGRDYGLRGQVAGERRQVGSWNALATRSRRSRPEE